MQAAVSYALQNGYRLVDCAYCYGNEDEVGQGLKEAFGSGAVKRDDVFIMTKAWATYNTRIEEGLDKSLKSLGLDYVDLYLIVSLPLRHQRFHMPCRLALALAGQTDRQDGIVGGEADVVDEGSTGRFC